jgi:hypothetical protein
MVRLALPLCGAISIVAFLGGPFKPNTRRPAIVRRHQDITRHPAGR